MSITYRGSSKGAVPVLPLGLCVTWRKGAGAGCKTPTNFLPKQKQIPDAKPAVPSKIRGTTTTTTRTTKSYENVLEGPSREFDYVESVKISGNVDPYMRSRNVYFNGNGLKPFTKHYPFLDSQQPDICPKLVEIEMKSGTFQVFEKAKVFLNGIQIARLLIQAPNQKFGDKSRPDIGAGLGSPSVLVEKYTVDPYDRTRPAPGDRYSASSKLLNFGVRVLANQPDNYYGYVVKGSIVVGETTGATAVITRSELITDNWGDVIGNIYFRDPHTSPPPSVLIRTGSKTFKLTATPPGTTPLPGSTEFASEAQGSYSGSGTILTQETTSVNVRNPPPPATRPSEVNVKVKATHRDPLAQSFTVDGNGAFLTSFDVYFARKDPSAKLFVELRTVELGTPTNFLVQDYTQIALNPTNINTSPDASIPTNIKFKSPVYLEADKEYALVFLSPASDLYEMWVATMGQKSIRSVSSVIKSMVGFDDSYDQNNPQGGRPGFFGDVDYQRARSQGFSDADIRYYLENVYTGQLGPKMQQRLNDPNWGVISSLGSLPNVDSVVVSKQYIGGSLFKSQNGTIWTSSQYQDLTFKLYKAEFVSSGSLTFYNTPVVEGTTNAGKLPLNPIKTLPRKLKVPITGTSGLNTILTRGRTVGEGNVSDTSVTGIIENVGSPISSTGTGAVEIVSGGSGYADNTYTGVSLYSITGSGTGALATVVVSGGVVTSVNITSTGSGYVTGETVGITTSSLSGAGAKGTGAKINIKTISSTIDTLYLTGVQGEQFNSGQTLIYYNNDIRTTTSASINGTSSLLGDLYSGNVFQVTQYNHAHHGANNLIKIENVQPDTPFVQLMSDFSINSTTVSVADTSSFATFEGISTSSGYALINSEIVQYTSIGTGTLTIGERGVNETSITDHIAGSGVQKYECNGVSLTRINTVHTLPSNENLKRSSGIDKYYLQFERTNRSSGFSQLSFVDEKSLGGNYVRVSQNHQFSSINPQFNIITPGKGTQVSAQIRTISGTSAGGSEVSFLDQGFETITLNKSNFFPNPRLIASKINESNRLTSLPQNKSLSLRVDFVSSDVNLSPVMDIQNAIFVLSRNKINRPITDYALDDRSNKLSGDPHGSVFITNKVDLQQPASSLQVLIGANRPPESDFRVFYRLFRADSTEITQSYIAFPGYDNMKDSDGDGYGDQIIDISKNSGRPDAQVAPSVGDSFSEYQFTANNLAPFTGFVIKIVMSSTNESSTVTLSDFRAIALA